MRGEHSRGFTLVELLVSLLLGSLLVGTAFRAYGTLGAVGRQVSQDAALVGALRSSRAVLRSELLTGVPSLDWSPYPPDSVRLRAFRALGTICGISPDSALIVTRRNGRRPDPGKDSVLVLDGRGDWSTVALTSWASNASCPGMTERWEVDPRPMDPALLLLFETGSYHLSGAALRYRRGGGGRQPLTEEALPGARLLDTLGVLRAVLRIGSSGAVTVDLAATGGGS
jgi:prepilin-type N-terminal cleavage/methylation domain-containing protein